MEEVCSICSGYCEVLAIAATKAVLQRSSLDFGSILQGLTDHLRLFSAVSEEETQDIAWRMVLKVLVESGISISPECSTPLTSWSEGMGNN